MTAYIEDTFFLNEKAIKIGNDILEAIIVPDLGSKLLSLKDKTRDIELLRSPTSWEEYGKAPILHGMPVLFPPNRIEDGQFTYKDKKYTFPINEKKYDNYIHGFLHDKPWKVTERESEGEKALLTTEFSSMNFPSLKEEFPHEFIAKLTFNLVKENLGIVLEIQNRGVDPFPWGAGYHTVFNFPFEPLSKLEDCRVSLPVHEKWQLNERHLPTGEVQQLENPEAYQNGLDLTGCKFDDLFSVDDSLSVNEAVLTDERAGVQVRYQADSQFKHWVLFNQEGFVCPEPYTWVTNAPNLDLPPDKTGIRELMPEESVQLKTRITVKQI